MSRMTSTQHTVRCPLSEDTAYLQVRTEADAAPSRRHRDVTACSLLAPRWFVAPGRRAYFSDVPPPVSYLCDGEGPPRQPAEMCTKRCLGVLNAAEPGAAVLRCSSGVSDALDLARQTQSPALTRVMWMHSV